MNVTVYADVLFFINFSMDFLTLYIVSFILKIRFYKFRAVLSATLGALYGVFSVLRHKDNIVIAVAVAIIMCCIAFGLENIKCIFSEMLTFIAVSFLLGGGMTVIFNIFNSFGYQRKVSIYGQIDTVEKPMSIPVFVFGFIIIACLSLVFCRLFTRKGKARTVKTEITFGDKTVNLFLSEDSGNLLCEPSSGDPVIFLTEKAFEKLFGKEMAEKINSLDTSVAEMYRDRFRITVYETVGGRGIAACIRPDKIKVDGKDVRAFITASGKPNFGIYDGIIPSVLLSEKSIKGEKIWKEF